MERSLLRNEVLPFVGAFALLLGVTALSDLLLHRLGLVWIGRFLGIPGTLLIVLSLLYSLRKRKIIQSGSPKALLRAHELMAWVGSLMVMVHAGIHFNAILPWLALVAMLVNVGSGMVGRHLLDRSRRHLQAKRELHREAGRSAEDAERALFWDAVAFSWMAQWRAVHMPISLAFALLALAHIASVLVFWEWR